MSPGSAVRNGRKLRVSARPNWPRPPASGAPNLPRWPVSGPARSPIRRARRSNSAAAAGTDLRSARVKSLVAAGLSGRFAPPLARSGADLMTTGDFEPQPGQYGQPGPYGQPGQYGQPGPTAQPGQYGQPGGYGYPPPLGGEQPGGLGLRFFARLIDGIIVGIVGFLLAVLLGATSNIWVTGLFSGLLTFIYFVAFEVTQGWTPGKKLLGLSVRGPGGAPKPTAAQSAIRNALYVVVDHSVHRRPARRGGLHRDRGDDQQQPDQTGQARRDRRRNPGRQGLSLRLRKIPRTVAGDFAYRRVTRSYDRSRAAAPAPGRPPTARFP